MQKIQILFLNIVGCYSKTPRWADGWTQSPMGKKRPANECEGSNTQDQDGGISEGVARSQSVYNERPGE